MELVPLRHLFEVAAQEMADLYGVADNINVHSRLMLYTDDGKEKEEVKVRRPDRRLARRLNYGRVACANLPGERARFFFESTDGELGAITTIGKIFADPLLEPTAAFALGDVNEIMQEQFAIAPAVGANDNGVAESDAPGLQSEDAGAARGFGECRIVRQRNAIDHQDPDTIAILNSRAHRILAMLWAEGRAVGENEFLLFPGPSISRGHELFECLVVDHESQKK
jgi:hypothetical protein